MPVLDLPIINQYRARTTSDELRALIDRVKEEVDLREYLVDRLDDYKEFDRYWLTHCLNPEHTDHNRSALVYPDQFRCLACDWKADAIDFYKMANPDATAQQAAEALLADEKLRFTGEVTARVIRSLDQDLAAQYHFELIKSPTAMKWLADYGILPASTRYFQLGLARVLVRLDEAPEGVEVIWKDTPTGKEPYQWQDRISVPVFNGGRLVQFIYRRLGELGPKTTMEKNAGVWLYNSDALATAKVVIFAEGWGDVIIDHQFGIVGVCSTAGANHFNNEWAALFQSVRRVYVAGDADNAGQRMIQKVKKAIPWARPLALPYEVGSKKDQRNLWLDGYRTKEMNSLLRRSDNRAVWTSLKRVTDA